MSRQGASALVLRSRLVLERLRNGETDRALIDHLSQIVIITGFVTRTGYGKLDMEKIDRVEQGLAQVLTDLDDIGSWNVPGSLIGELTEVVNEYDRVLGAVRLEIFAKASDHLERLMTAALNEKLTHPDAHRAAALPPPK